MLSSLLSIYIASSISNPISESPTVNSSINIPFSIELQTTPVKKHQFISPIIDAKGSIAVDMASGHILYEKNSHERMPIASITKLMTALIILEENDLNDVTTVSSNSASTEGSTMYLRAGEQIAIENLLYGIMINSANDAAVALAEYNAGSVSEFVDKMNKKAKLLGLVNTHFANPIGLDNSENYSSAFDVAKMSRFIYQNQFIQHAAGIKYLEVRSDDKAYTHKLESTNDLLENEYFHIKGLKTGHTDGAGLCLSSIAENDNGNEIITVVLNSPARFTETKILVDWLFRAYTW